MGMVDAKTSSLVVPSRVGFDKINLTWDIG